MIISADILTHRQLAASIGYAPLHPSLYSKSIVERIMDVINRRHRMAQMAGRASVEFYVSLALKVKSERARERREVVMMKQEKEKEKGGVQEEAFVIRTFRNGVSVFVSK